jgi:excisionase family DNA binding protein
MSKIPLTVSIAHAAKMLSVNEQTIARSIKTGKLPASKVRRRVVIKVSDLNKLLTDNRKK